MKQVFLILFLCAVFGVQAQEKSNSSFYLGINPGFSFSRINTSSSYEDWIDLYRDQEFTPVYSGGIVFIYYSEPNLGLQMELNYSQRGWAKGITDSLVYRRRLDYLEFPFLSHFDIGRKKFHFTITAGPSISYLLADRAFINADDPPAILSIDQPQAENRVELGLCVGLGANLFTKLGIIQLEVRVHQGLNHVFPAREGTEFPASRNQVVGAKLSWLYPL
ncbi:MAG TPA: porin family protein [Prolixibacteraceae bacterium]|nr:porin family protein [Prolixibacteraceae bacterium]